MLNKRFYIILILITMLLFTGCEEQTETVVISVGTTPEREYVIQEPTATPTPEPTPEPTPTPTPELVEAYDYIEDLTLTSDDRYLVYSGWDFGTNGMAFTIGGQSYNKGIGMYVRSKDITDESASVTYDWTLARDYHKISFDLGCEENLQYGAEEKYGTYQITIYADDTLIWDSGLNDYQYTSIGTEIEVPEGSGVLTVTLTETKGINGTLNVALGSFKLYYYE